MKSLRAAALVKMWTPPPPPPSKGGARKSPVPRRSVKEGKGGKMLKKVSDHKKGRMGEHQSKQALSSVWPHNRSL